ncbi:unnamed protein product [Closterium sp. NIES-53]
MFDTGGAGATCAGGVRAGAASAGGARAGGTEGAGAEGAGAADGADQSQPQLLPGSQLPVPAPHTEVIESLTERREPETRASTLVCACLVARPCPPAVPGTHVMALRPSSVPLHVALPSPPASSLPDFPDPESDLARAASPAVTCLLATVITDPDSESTAAFALLTELVDFVTRSLSVSVLRPSGGDPDALDIPTPRSYAEAIAGTYVDEVPPPGVNIVDGMWIFRVKRPSGSPPAFRARYVARGFSQRQGVDFFQTFSPTPKMTTLRVLLHVAAHCEYELHSLDFSTPFLQGSLHEEIWLRHPPGFTGSFPKGTRWSLRRPVYGLRQAPREWHDTLRTTHAALGFSPSTADPSLFPCTDPTPPPFYILMYVDELVFATADTEALTLVKAELQKRHTCTELGELRSYLGLHITWDIARCTITLTQSHMVHLQRFRFRFSLPQPTPLPFATHSQLHLRTSPCEAEIYVGAMVAQELRRLTYLLTDLGVRLVLLQFCMSTTRP